MFNQIIVAGRLGKDPVVKTVETKNGEKAVATFNLACTVRTGKGESVTQWFQVTRWGAQAPAIGQYMSKGSPVLVTGRLQTREYEDKNGVTKTSVEILADQVTFLPQPKASAPAAGSDESGNEDNIGFE